MLKRGIQSLGVVATLLFSTTAGGGAELIGTTIPPLPSGFSEGGGVCVGSGGQVTCERSIGILKNSAGEDVLIYAGTRDYSAGMKVQWRVTDTLSFPKVPRGAEFGWWECRKSGVPDPSIMAVVRSNSKRDWLRARGWAYGIDFATGRFVKLDPKDIDCANSALDDP